jgi:hypothetical protein
MPANVLHTLHPHLDSAPQNRCIHLEIEGGAAPSGVTLNFMTDDGVRFFGLLIDGSHVADRARMGQPIAFRAWPARGGASVGTLRVRVLGAPDRLQGDERAWAERLTQKSVFPVRGRVLVEATIVEEDRVAVDPAPSGHLLLT